jgi:ubiquinone biosynthesis protein
MILFKNIRRYRQIAAVLARHGFGWLLVQFGLSRLVPYHRGLFGHPKREQRYSAPEHLRMAFEELGPTFIKLAQILSTRPDLISPSYAEEFARLQDKVPPLPFSEMLQTLEQEWDKSYQEIFPQFDTEPLASASIGQVYRAALPGGNKVAVKIQKPGVQDIIERDLAILGNIAGSIKKRTEFGKRYDLEGLLDEFAFTIKNELDYRREAENMDKFRFLFKDEQRLYIPEVIREWSTARVLVMEEITGIKVNELNQTKVPFRIDRHAVAVAAVEITLTEIFRHGFFHGDPHPGNFFIMRGNRLGLMDFGMVGFVTENDKEAFFRFSYALAAGEVENMMDALWDMGIIGDSLSSAAVKRELGHLYYDYRSKTMEEVAASDLVNNLMRISYRHQLYFPPDMALLFKVLAMCESLAAMVEPGFKLFEFALPYLKERSRELFSVENIAHQVKEDSLDLLRLIHGLPRRINRLIRQVERGKTQVNIKQKDLENESRKIYGALNRIMIIILMLLFSMLFGVFTLIAHFLSFHSLLLTFFLGVFVVTSLVSLKMVWDAWRTRYK